MRKGTVYILFSELESRHRFKAARFVQANGFIPTYPTIVGDFFDSIESKRSNSDDLIRRADQVWVFGKVNASMHEQVLAARRLGKEVKFYHVYEGQFLEDRPEDAMSAA